jgi:hypothetical protein
MSKRGVASSEEPAAKRQVLETVRMAGPVLLDVLVPDVNCLDGETNHDYFGADSLAYLVWNVEGGRSRLMRRAIEQVEHAPGAIAAGFYQHAYKMATGGEFRNVFLKTATKDSSKIYNIVCAPLAAFEVMYADGALDQKLRRMYASEEIRGSTVSSVVAALAPHRRMILEKFIEGVAEVICNALEELIESELSPEATLAVENDLRRSVNLGCLE